MSAVVTNGHDAPLSVGGVTIGPGASALIQNWGVVKTKPEVAQWHSLGLISAQERDKESDDADRTALISELEAAGVEVDGRWGAKRLKHELAALSERDEARDLSGANNGNA